MTGGMRCKVQGCWRGQRAEQTWRLNVMERGGDTAWLPDAPLGWLRQRRSCGSLLGKAERKERRKRAMGSRGKQGAGAVLWFHDPAGKNYGLPIMPYKEQIICLLMGHDCTSEGWVIVNELINLWWVTATRQTWTLLLIWGQKADLISGSSLNIK